MMTLSLDFSSKSMFNNALNLLNAKNADSFLLNISISVENEIEANDIVYDLEFKNIQFESKLY